MPRTAQIFSDNGHQAVRLPEDIHISGTEIDVLQDQRTGAITLIPRDQYSTEQQQRSWDELFKLLDELGPVEEDFMAHRDREKQLYADLAEQVAKPPTLDRFFKTQQDVGPGEEDFLADRDTSPAHLRDVF